MDTFSDALLSPKTDRIPDEYDWFAPLLGDWDCDYYDELFDNRRRHVKGEWIFRRVLEGTGIQDISSSPPGPQRKMIRSRTVNTALPSACSTGISVAMTWSTPARGP